MSTIALQDTTVRQRHYFRSDKLAQKADKQVQKTEKKYPQYVIPSIDREKTLHSIAFLTQYMEDLKAGKPVENIHPDNDPYFLVPENIAAMIEADKYLLQGGKCIVVDTDNIWESLGIE